MCDYSKFTVSWTPVDGPMPTPCHVRLKPDGAPSVLDRDGYAHVTAWINGKQVRRTAHGVRYAMAFGPVPDGLVLDHLCKNRWCCNPEHLEPVHQAENVRRSRSAKLTPEQVNDIRLLVAQGESQASVSRNFGVHQSHVSRIVRGEFWSEGACPAWEIVKSRRADARAAR